MATQNGNESLTGKHLGILGTGQYASGFSGRLLAAGYCVTMGSRRPDSPHPFIPFQKQDTTQNPASPPETDVKVNDVRVTSLEDCIRENEVIVVALHADHFRSTFNEKLARLCAGKILVDVSNRSSSRRIVRRNGSSEAEPASNAHLLTTLVPGARIVKAFNSVSAYVMENDATMTGGTRSVAVASDDAAAQAAVCALVRDMGFEPLKKGGLAKAVEMEESVLRVFPEWRLPVLAALALLLFWLLFAIARFYVADDKLAWAQLPLKVFNKVMAATALSLLSLTYLPSSCAAILQIARGTKRQRFPSWLDAWLKSRKQLGLLAFLLTSMHALTSALELSPTYVSSWYPANSALIRIPPTNQTARAVRVTWVGGAWMTWVGELSLFAALLAFALMTLLAMTSLPSVASSLGWREWRLVHSRLGHVMLTLAVTHVYVMGVEKWVSTGFPLVLFRVKFLSIVLPTAVIACRLLLLLPCVDSYVTRIRSGWERGQAPDSSA